MNHNPFSVHIGACGVSKAGAGVDCDANTLLGYALYFYTYSTWKGKALYLEDLYITPGCRGQGLGSALFNRVAKVGLCKHSRFPVITVQQNSINLTFMGLDRFGIIEDLRLSEGAYIDLSYHSKCFVTAPVVGLQN
jgi:GNAT superfamily N-acetyltransferase